MALIVQIGFIVFFIGSLILLYRFVQFSLFALLGKNFTLTYVDRNGSTKTKRIRVGKDAELVALLEEIKSSANCKKDGAEN